MFNPYLQFPMVQNFKNLIADKNITLPNVGQQQAQPNIYTQPNPDIYQNPNGDTPNQQQQPQFSQVRQLLNRGR
jgi:hypothetical protein